MDNYFETQYYKNMENLSAAYKYCSENFSHEDIINVLYNDDDLKKQICLIELSKINNQQEADILVYNLTEHSGPVRETASFKILELIQNDVFNKFFQTDEILDAFVKSVTDINPSISRNAAEIIKYIDNKQYLYDKIAAEIQKTLKAAPDLKQSRSYKTNKRNFGIFWNLDALAVLAGKVRYERELEEILRETAFASDYTLREKTAETACAYKLKEILTLLKADENIYVRRFLPEETCKTVSGSDANR